MIAVEVEIAPDAVVSAFVGRRQADFGGDVGEIPIAVVAVELTCLVRGIRSGGDSQIIVHEEVEITIVVVVDRPTAVEVAADVGNEAVPKNLGDVFELIIAHVAKDVSGLLIGADHEEVEHPVVVEVDELGVIAIVQILRAIGVGDVDEPKRARFNQLVLVEVVANIAAGNAG